MGWYAIKPTHQPSNHPFLSLCTYYDGVNVWDSESDVNYCFFVCLFIYFLLISMLSPK